MVQSHLGICISNEILILVFCMEILNKVAYFTMKWKEAKIIPLHKGVIRKMLEITNLFH